LLYQLSYSGADPEARRSADHDPREYRSYSLDRGVNWVVHLVVRAILQPVFHVYFRMRRVGSSSAATAS
jgi:hypothetical protein